MPSRYGKRGRLSKPQSSDWLIKFSHNLTTLKFIIFEIVVFMGFLAYLWGKVRHDLGL